MRDEIRKQLISLKKEKYMKYSAFNEDRATVSNLMNHGTGTFKTLCSIADQLGYEVVIIPKLHK